MIRINKYLAEKGLATRKKADELVARGLVLINNKPAVLGQKVTEHDTVTLKGIAEEFRYMLYHKPAGMLTLAQKAGEVDVPSDIKKKYKLSGLFPVGRLDKSTAGLVLVTDDGRVTERALNPEHAHARTFQVTLDKPVTPRFVRLFAQGIKIEGYTTKPAQVTIHIKDPRTCTIILTESEKHQIKRMCVALGYQVISVTRIGFLNLSLKTLKSGQIYKLNSYEIKSLKKLLKIV